MWHIYSCPYSTVCHCNCLHLLLYVCVCIILFVCAPSGASTSRACVFWHCKDQIIPNLSHLSVIVITCFIYSLCLFNFFCLWNKGRWQRCPKQGIIMMWRRSAAALPAQAGRFSSALWWLIFCELGSGRRVYLLGLWGRNSVIPSIITS